jgi:phenylalanine-4-hydroxylase
MLSAKPKYRSDPQRLLLRKLIKTMWPELLKYPINPTSTIKGRIIKSYIHFLSYFGLYSKVLEFKRINKGNNV